MSIKIRLILAAVLMFICLGATFFPCWETVAEGTVVVRTSPIRQLATFKKPDTVMYFPMLEIIFTFPIHQQREIK